MSSTISSTPVSSELTLTPFLTLFLHNATKKLLSTESTLLVSLNQCCQDIYTHGIIIVFERSTTMNTASSTDKLVTSTDEEWVVVDTGGLGDVWVDVEQGVPNDIGRGASDVSKGTLTVSQTAAVLEVLREYYKKESVKVFTLRMENTKK